MIGSDAEPSHLTFHYTITTIFTIWPPQPFCCNERIIIWKTFFFEKGTAIICPSDFILYRVRSLSPFKSYQSIGMTTLLSIITTNIKINTFILR